MRCPVCFNREIDVLMSYDDGRYSCLKCSYAGTEGEVRQLYKDIQKKFKWIIDPPTALHYFPWNPDFDGTARKRWMVTAPPISHVGETFDLYASLWNRPPLLVVWTYRAEYH